ncbi:MAG: hypothetical protein J6W09_04350 [Bacteroidales bacterium]|nr:hypothetical protein [Bacteroidales bacterium]
MSDYSELVKALRLCQFGECGCGKCYYKELKGDWCTEDNHPEFFDCDDKLKLDAAAAIESLQAKVADYEDTLKWHQKEFAELRAMIDDANERLEVGKAGNQYKLIEPKNKRYTLRCPKCGTVVGLMEVQDG